MHSDEGALPCSNKAQHLRGSRLGLVRNGPLLFAYCGSKFRSVRVEVTLETGRSETFESESVESSCSAHFTPTREDGSSAGGKFICSLCIVPPRPYRLPPRSEATCWPAPSCAQLIASASRLRTHSATPVLTRATSCLVVQITAHHPPASSKHRNATLSPALSSKRDSETA